MAILGRQYNKYSMKLLNNSLTYSNTAYGQVSDEFGVAIRFKPYIISGTLLEKPEEWKIWLDGTHVAFGLWNGLDYNAIYSIAIDIKEWHTIYVGINYYNDVLSQGFEYICVDNIMNYTQSSISAIPTTTSNPMILGNGYYGLIDDIKFYVLPITQEMIRGMTEYGYVYDNGLQIWNTSNNIVDMGSSTFRSYDALGDEYFEGTMAGYTKGKEAEDYENVNVVIITKE